MAAQIEYRSFRNYWVPNPNHTVVAARCDFKPLRVEREATDALLMTRIISLIPSIVKAH